MQRSSREKPKFFGYENCRHNRQNEWSAAEGQQGVAMDEGLQKGGRLA
jgi:hypothetical protein